MVTKVKLLDSAIAIPSAATGTTQSASDNSTKLATTAYVTTAVSNLVDGAPSTLNTLNEIAAALNDDAALNTTLTNSIATKLPLAGGTLTGALTTNGVINTGTSHNFAINTPNSLRINIDSNDSGTSEKFIIGHNQTAVDTSNSLMTILESGNVGIGTSSPAVALDIASSSTTQMRVQMSGQADTRVLSDTGTGIIGTYSDHPLTIKTNGSTVATINSTGVGIGETSPDAPLHITSNTPIIVYDESDTSQEFRLGSFGGAFALYDSNDSAFRALVDGDGNVGIGTTSPQNTFHVNSGSSNNVARFESTDTEARVLFKDSTGIAYIASRNDFRFGNDTTTERMRLTAAGKLGIGATNVNALLHLNGDGDAIRVESTNTGAGGAQVDLLHYSTSPADEDINGVINFGGYYSGTNSAYGASIKSVWSDVSHKKGRLEFYTRDDSTFVHHMQINHHGGIAMGANNAGYDGQVLSIKAGTGDNVLYGESSDANCIISLRDNSSTMNIGYGVTGNAHIFSQDGSEIARISTGSADKYPTSGGLGGIGGSGTNLHLLADDSEIRMANNIIHSDNSGLTKFTIRAAYGALSSGAELSLDGGYISFNTGTNFVETMRAHTGVLSIGNSTTIASSATSYLNVGTGSGSATISIYSGTSGYGYLNFADGTSGAGADPGYMRYNHNDNTFYFNRSVSGPSFSSDRAKKENITDLDGGLIVIKELQPRNFDWKKDDLTEDYLPGMPKGAAGFIAQELETVLPKEVHGIDGEKGISPMGIIAHLVKAVQQQQEQIDRLKADIEVLGG